MNLLERFKNAETMKKIGAIALLVSCIGVGICAASYFKSAAPTSTQTLIANPISGRGIGIATTENVNDSGNRNGAIITDNSNGNTNTNNVVDSSVNSPTHTDNRFVNSGSNVSITNGPGIQTIGSNNQVIIHEN